MVKKSRIKSRNLESTGLKAKSQTLFLRLFLLTQVIDVTLDCKNPLNVLIILSFKKYAQSFTTDLHLVRQCANAASVDK